MNKLKLNYYDINDIIYVPFPFTEKLRKKIKKVY